jgi:hypothetical protein
VSHALGMRLVELDPETEEVGEALERLEPW